MSTFTKQLIHTAAIALIAAACTQTDDETPQGRAISFRPAAETRAAVEKGDIPADFLVWGGYGATHLLFDGETVHSPGWNYDGGTRYWVPGEWNFYAIHPKFSSKSGVKTDVDMENGTFKVTDFDASATGTEAVDLMTASAPITYSESEGSNPPTSVGLAFHHELARVNVIIVSEGDAVNISNAKLYGISHTGSLDGNTWSLGTVSGSSQPSFTTTTLEIADTQEHLLFGGDLLLPPHNTLGDEATLEFDYQYTTGDTSSKSSTIKLKTASVTAWEKAKRYNYRIKIPRNAVEVELTVEVADWEQKDYTVEW